MWGVFIDKTRQDKTRRREKNREEKKRIGKGREVSSLSEATVTIRKEEKRLPSVPKIVTAHSLPNTPLSHSPTVPISHVLMFPTLLSL